MPIGRLWHGASLAHSAHFPVSPCSLPPSNNSLFRQLRWFPRGFLLLLNFLSNFSPSPRVLVVRPARRETFLRQRGDAESFNCRHVTAHPPRHLSTPSVSLSASHPFLNQICSLSLGPSHSAEDIVHRVFSRHALLLLSVRRRGVVHTRDDPA